MHGENVRVGVQVGVSLVPVVSGVLYKWDFDVGLEDSGKGFLFCSLMLLLMHLMPFSASLHDENVRVGVEVGLS